MFRWLCAVFFAVVIVAPGLAAAVTIAFSGTVTESQSGGPGNPASHISVGDRFWGSLSYDDQLLETFDSGFADRAYGEPAVVHWEVGGLSETVQQLGEFPILLEDTATFDVLGSYSEPGSVLGDIGYLDMDLTLRDLDGNLVAAEDFDGPFVPTPSVAELAGLDAGTLYFHLADDYDTWAWEFFGVIDDVRVLGAVPEPSSAVLLGVGALVVGAALRRRATR